MLVSHLAIQKSIKDIKPKKQNNVVLINGQNCIIGVKLQKTVVSALLTGFSLHQ